MIVKRKLTSIMIMILISFMSSGKISAQINKGDFLLSGSLLYSSSKNTLDRYDIESKTTNTSFEVGGEYFLSPNFSLGAGLGFHRASATYEDPFYDIDSKSSSFRIGALASYWVPVSDNTFFRPIAGFALISQDDNDFEISGLLLALGAGLPVFISNYVFVSPQLLYRFGSLEDDDNDEWDYSDFQFGISIGTLINSNK